jgi:hypothetical protein
LGFPVEYAINEDIHYDASVLEKFPVSAPTPIELIMAGMGLSAKDREIQANNKYITHFPSWPLTTKEEIKIAVCSRGLQISCGAGYYCMSSMKTQTTTFDSMEKRIGMSPPTGFGTLSYLAAMTGTTRTDRFSQQANLLRYFREVGYQPILFALSRGECLIYSEKEEHISTLASSEIRAVVQSICTIAAGWPTYRYTHIHKEATLLSKNYTNLIALDAKVILIIDSFLRRGIRLFLPPSLAMRMNFVSSDFAADRLPAAGIIALMLSDDKSEGSMTAKSDRAELDKALSNVKLSRDMFIEHFRVLYETALEDYNACSSIQKWVDTKEGREEQIEFLLHLLGESDGKLKEKVSTKFDKLRSAAIIDETEHPGIDKFWELLTTVHTAMEHHKLRTVTTTNPNKRLRDEQQVTTWNMDGGSQPLPCFNFQKGKCNRGSKCGFSLFFLESSFITHSTGRRPALARRPPQGPLRILAHH